MQIKTTALLSLCAFSSALIFVNCNKQPVADFTMDKEEYTSGETVKCTNKSQDGKTYKWTFPDGQTSTAKNVDYTLPASTPAGSYPVKLEAFSNKQKKISEISKSFTVKAATGKLTVWTSNSSASQISVKVDNVSLGSITLFYGSNPGCGANGCVTANLTVGSHSVSATDGVLTWNGNTTVTKDGCVTFQLQ
ncbi:MAG: hypothetical protein K0S32_2534 [Bacteroidetes bacterium]|jgi:PKD repeat protein|nr:hypothetical protein [Bacteroidota bacterium]